MVATSSSKTVLVIGKSGQLARALNLVGERLGWKVHCAGRGDADLGAEPSVLAPVLSRTMDSIRPDLVINASAFTDVDGAEKTPELAFALNARGPECLAHLCARREIPLFHVSTDYVFSGDGDQPWRETDRTQPLNQYGKSKLAGEHLVLQAHPKGATVFRTAWVFSETGKGFMPWVAAQLRSGKPIQMVSDQVGTPTYAPHLALILLQLGEGLLTGVITMRGVLHCVPRGFVFRPDLVRFMAEEMQCKLQMTLVTSEQMNQGRAARPLNSCLDTSQLQMLLQTLQAHFPTWQDGVREFLRQI